MNTIWQKPLPKAVLFCVFVFLLLTALPGATPVLAAADEIADSLPPLFTAKTEDGQVLTYRTQKPEKDEWWLQDFIIAVPPGTEKIRIYPNFAEYGEEGDIDGRTKGFWYSAFGDIPGFQPALIDGEYFEAVTYKYDEVLANLIRISSPVYDERYRDASGDEQYRRPGNIKFEFMEPMPETLNTNHKSSYSNASIWLNLGGTFKYAEAGDPVKYYLTDVENGKAEDAIPSTLLETTVDKVKAKTPSTSKDSNGFIVPTGLAAGQYWVAVQAGEGDHAYYLYQPFTVYEDAKAYTKASLDKLIEFYATSDSEGDYFWGPMPGPLGGYYSGLAHFKDTDTDWEAWIFPTLGESYTYRSSTGSNQTLAMTLTGSFLSGKMGKKDVNYFANVVEPNLKKQLSKLSSKDCFRAIAAITALGGDPRNFDNTGSSATNTGYDIVNDRLIGIYFDKNGKLYTDPKTGALITGGLGVLGASYWLLALEIANATPEEGYTKEVKVAAVKALLPILEQSVNATSSKDILSTDYLTMMALPLYFLKDDEDVKDEYGERLSTALDKMDDLVIKYSYANGGLLMSWPDVISEDDPDAEAPTPVTAYAGNTNSMAVTLNALAFGGVTASDFDDPRWQKEGGNLLTALVSQQMEDGTFAYGGMTNHKASTQALGALVELYAGTGCFVNARDTYMANFAQYSDGGRLFAKIMEGLPADAGKLQWSDAVNVAAARNVYTEMYTPLKPNQQTSIDSHFEAELQQLAQLEGETGRAVAAGIGLLPDKAQVRISDQSLITAVRAAYNSLSEQQKTVANGEGNQNLTRLREAESALNQWEAKEVTDFILSLPSAADVTELDRTDIEAARAAYDGLSEDKRVLVEGSTLKVLRDAERALVLLASKHVAANIDNLPEPKDVRITDQSAVKMVRAAYDALTEEQKAVITNYSKLQRVEAVLAELLKAADLDAAAAQAVSDRINALPAADAVAVKDKEAIEGARAAYDKLTDTQKALVPAEALDKLAAVEKALQDLGGQETGRPIDKMVDLKDPSAWYYEPIAKCMDEGLFKGDNNNQFNPQNNITRAEFAQVLYNYYKDDENVMKTEEGKTFNDVQAGKWYYEAIDACAKAGLIAGDDKGNFNPDKPILRQDVALIMMRLSIGADAIEALDVEALLQDLANQNLSFSDFPATSPYAQKAMAAAAGVIFFGNDGKLQPQSNITRAEMAQVMYNFLFK